MKKNFVKLGVFFTVSSLLGLSSCNSNNNQSDCTENLYEVTNQQTSACPNCNGYGIYGGLTCIVCNGSGQVQFDQVETHSYNNINFKGSTYIYGPCNSGCGCKGYAHAPGQTTCINCAYYNCTTNKSGHKKLYY